MTEDFQWKLQGRCYKLGHDVPHAGGVVPNRIITGRYFDPKEIVPHLFEAVNRATSSLPAATSAWARR
jgi:3-isopropylmalate/(R)-2-methylmalate dehydratase small subunit